MGLTPIYGHATVGKIMTGHKILHAYSPNLLAMKKTNLEPHGISQPSNFKSFIFSKKTAQPRLNHKGTGPSQAKQKASAWRRLCEFLQLLKSHLQGFTEGIDLSWDSNLGTEWESHSNDNKG
jgi:hypothetical protein